MLVVIICCLVSKVTQLDSRASIGSHRQGGGYGNPHMFASDDVITIVMF